MGAACAAGCWLLAGGAGSLAAARHASLACLQPLICTAILPCTAAMQWGNLRYAANVAFTVLLRANQLPAGAPVSLWLGRDCSLLAWQLAERWEPAAEPPRELSPATCSSSTLTCSFRMPAAGTGIPAGLCQVASRLRHGVCGQELCGGVGREPAAAPAPRRRLLPQPASQLQLGGVWVACGQPTGVCCRLLRWAPGTAAIVCTGEGTVQP